MLQSEIEPKKELLNGFLAIEILKVDMVYN